MSYLRDRKVTEFDLNQAHQFLQNLDQLTTELRREYTYSDAINEAASKRGFTITGNLDEEDETAEGETTSTNQEGQTNDPGDSTDGPKRPETTPGTTQGESSSSGAGDGTNETEAEASERTIRETKEYQEYKRLRDSTHSFDERRMKHSENPKFEKLYQSDNSSLDPNSIYPTSKQRGAIVQVRKNHYVQLHPEQSLESMTTLRQEYVNGEHHALEGIGRYRDTKRSDRIKNAYDFLVYYEGLELAIPALGGTLPPLRYDWS